MASGAAARRAYKALELLPSPSLARGASLDLPLAPPTLAVPISNLARPLSRRTLAFTAPARHFSCGRSLLASSPSPSPSPAPPGIAAQVFGRAFSVRTPWTGQGISSWGITRGFSTATVLWQQPRERPSVTSTQVKQEVVEKEHEGEQNKELSQQEKSPDQHGFQQSERAKQAAQVNMRARLSKEGKSSTQGGWAEILRLIKIARPEVKWLGISCVFLLISSAVTMSIPFSVGRILDIATSSKDAPTVLGLSLTQFFLGFAAFMTLGAVANFGRVVLLRIVGERVVARLRTQLYRRTYVQDAEFFDANRVGDLISRLSSDTVIVGKSITQNISDGLRAIVSGATGFCAMAWLSPQLTSVILLMFPPIAVGAFFYGRTIRNISRQIQKNLGTLTKIAEERLGNIKTSQAFAGEIQEIGRYNHQVRKIFALGRRESIIAATFYGSTGWAGNMTILALLIVGGNLVRSGAMSLGDLTSFMMYTVFAGSSLFGVSGFYSELMKGVGAASRLFELQDRHPTIPATVGKKVVSAQGPIKFTDVSFAYPTRPAVTIFNGLNFEIPSGSNVCIVGPSGGGKSTVGSLLLRFYNPTKGTITINGVDINDMNVKSLRRRIGMVAQEPVLFSGTVAENIAYGKPQATRAEIVAAARKANCGFISDFPDGLETQVGARGAQLSGGQKQRLAIARALLKDPDILILDEATSALDAESETLVNAALGELLKGRNTTISIAHRLSTIKRSDQIIVLSSEGVVAEIGSYAKLSADPESAFSKLMEYQMHGGEPPAGLRPPRIEEHITEAEENEADLMEEEEEEADLPEREEELKEEDKQKRD
ncbi:hypothetical protein N8I77_009128 [Diaporthe amygdali]|uniref:Uncharacterized protein n=1 Tax=Phomopsis amygdali TaxID=1214568 RepID=A0AAD9SAE7_PHOAM|nr:hypothetical protein N8I77_009128 [Diaporthe amygdali]